MSAPLPESAISKKKREVDHWNYHDHGIARVNGYLWDVWVEKYHPTLTNVILVRYADGSITGVYLRDLHRPARAKKCKLRN